MSEENVGTLRQPLSVSGTSHRALEERLGLRFPRALGWAAAQVWRLPPRSRLRRAVSHRAMKLGLDSINRRDLEAAVLFYDSGVEYVTPPQIIPLGFDSMYRGREARMELQRKWIAEWGEFLFKPEELIDVGDARLLVIGRMEGSGLSSGVALDNDWAVLFTISAGRVTREQVFLDRAEALEAAGLSE